MNLSQTVWCLVNFFVPFKLLKMCALITLLLLLLLLYSSSSDRDLCDVHSVAVWNAPSEQPKSCLVLKSCLCARFCPLLLQDRKRNYPSFSPPSAHKGKKRGWGGGAITMWRLHFYGRSMWLIHIQQAFPACHDGLQDEIRGGDNLRINTASLPSSAAGRFSQTMTQSLGVAYFRLLLVRSCVKSGGGAVSGGGNVWSFLQNKSDHGRPSPSCCNTHYCYCISTKFFLFTS